jgi:hypothetical protein
MHILELFDPDLTDAVLGLLLLIALAMHFFTRRHARSCVKEIQHIAEGCLTVHLPLQKGEPEDGERG